MNVLFDDQIFHYQKFGGISRYFYELFTRFGQLKEVNPVIPFRYTANEYLLSAKEQFNFIPSSFLWDLKFPGKGKLWTWRDALFPRYNGSLQNRTSVLKRLSQGDIDIFHPTYYDDYYSDAVGSLPIVLTVYDMIYERFPESFPVDEVHRVLADKRKSIACADHIIVISESVKTDLIKFYSVDERKITVVYLGNSLKRTGQTENELFRKRLPSSYLLFVGNREGYKNFLFALKAIRDVLQQYPQLNIICTGKPFTGQEMKIFRELGIEERMHHLFASDEELSELYLNALAFIYPSRYEGFGIPVIEAMSSGCPVVMSNTGSFPEIGGEAGVYFDPENAESIRIAVAQCLNDEQLRSDLVRKGIERASLFSWERTIKETIEVYRSVLKTHQKKS